MLPSIGRYYHPIGRLAASGGRRAMQCPLAPAAGRVGEGRGIYPATRTRRQACARSHDPARGGSPRATMSALPCPGPCAPPNSRGFRSRARPITAGNSSGSMPRVSSIRWHIGESSHPCASASRSGLCRSLSACKMIEDTGARLGPRSVGPRSPAEPACASTLWDRECHSMGCECCGPLSWRWIAASVILVQHRRLADPEFRRRTVGRPTLQRPVPRSDKLAKSSIISRATRRCWCPLRVALRV